MDINEKKTGHPVTPRHAVYAAVCALPAVLTILFYALRSNTSAMDWVSTRVSAPVRGALGLLTSVYPFSLMEVLCVFAIVWLIYYIVRTIKITKRGNNKLSILSKRLLTFAVAILYVWVLFCWLWSSGYHAPGFAERNGFAGGGVTQEDLAAVTSSFADKANEYALLVRRDDEGRYSEDRGEIFDMSLLIYQNFFAEYPNLEGKLYRTKPMMFSWLMSRTGYTGVYFALTGEPHININAPVFLMPATIAHELAHQLGVFSEDEANFVGILACITSGFPMYEYAGYLMGLIYLRNALAAADSYAWIEISDGLHDEVKRDLQDHRDYWQSQKTVDTGIGILDSVLTAVNDTVSDAVNTVYDGYLRSQNQELGIRSYGACVDLLVEYFTAAPMAVANTAFGGIVNFKSVKLLNAS